MTLQSSVNVSLAYKAESTFGVAAGASGAKYLRRVSSNLTATKESFTSNEARPDMEVADLRHGARGAGGSVESELSLQSFDDFLEACLRGTWAAGASLDEGDLTSVTATASSSKFTFGGGDPVSLGMFVGAMIRFANLSVSANNSKNYRITGFGGTSNREVTVTPAPTDMTADTAFTVEVVGNVLATGTTERSFTIEQSYPNIDVSEQFVGCRIGQLQLRVAPNGMTTIGWSILGANGSPLSGASSPYFTSPTDAPTTGVLSGLDGSLRANGVEQGVVTGIDLSFNNNLSMGPVIGSNITAAIFYGRKVVTGNMSVYLKDSSFLDAFDQEDTFDVVIVLAAAGDEPKDFMVFNMQKVKLQSPSKTIGADGGVVASFPFQALLASGDGIETGSLVIQRSNA